MNYDSEFWYMFLSSCHTCLLFFSILILFVFLWYDMMIIWMIWWNAMIWNNEIWLYDDMILVLVLYGLLPPVESFDGNMKLLGIGKCPFLSSRTVETYLGEEGRAGVAEDRAVRPPRQLQCCIGSLAALGPWAEPNLTEQNNTFLQSNRFGFMIWHQATSVGIANEMDD